MKSYEKLLLENKAWVNEKLSADPDYFAEMAKEQHPKFLWIGSSDSRVSSTEITNTEPGEIFVHRNIGNIVSHTDFNLLSVLQYAVEVLRVEHIIVCGHYGSEAIRASLDHQHHGLLNKWIRHIKDVYRLHKEELDGITDFDEKINRLSEYNVQEQVLNLAKTSIVQHAWAEWQMPCLHGWIYDINTGLIKDMVTMDHKSEMDELYKFNFKQRGEGQYGFY
jgi:carbonic anhydrase